MYWVKYYGYKGVTKCRLFYREQNAAYFATCLGRIEVASGYTLWIADNLPD